MEIWQQTRKLSKSFTELSASLCNETNKKAQIEILMTKPHFVEIFHCAVFLAFLAW